MRHLCQDRPVQRLRKHDGITKYPPTVPIIEANRIVVTQLVSGITVASI